MGRSASGASHVGCCDSKIKAHPVDAHRANPEFDGGTWALVAIDTSKYDGRTEKFNITIPRRILAQVDEYAKSHGMTRSGFLVQAAELLPPTEN